MAPQLNTTTSIVDFLKSKGEESSFTARRKLFTEKGFSNRLGEFRGTASQNLALLRNLREPAPTQEITPPTPTTPTDAVTTAGAPPTTPPTPDITGAPPTAPTEPTFTEQIAERAPGAGGQFDLTQIPGVQAPTSADVLARARGETGVQLAEEQAIAERGRLPAQVEQGITDVKADFASRGLVFSGAENVAEQGVRDKAIADKFDIDLRFAKVLGGAIDRASTELGREIEDVISDARDQREEEVDFLADLGLAVNPQTGELFQTLQSLRDQRISEKEQVPRTQIRSVGGRELLIDLNTGDVVRDLGISKTGGAGPEGQPEFTANETKKLEQAGLSGAPRDEKLDFLFGEEDDLSKEERRNQQFEDAKTIVRANVRERVFGTKGKFLGQGDVSPITGEAATEEVTQTAIETALRQSTGLPIGDVRRIVEEVLGEKVPGSGRF